MFTPEDLTVHFKQPAVLPGIREQVIKGLTHHIESVRWVLPGRLRDSGSQLTKGYPDAPASPDLRFDHANFEIPVYADEEGKPADDKTAESGKKLVGGLVGHVVMNLCYIDLLWIDEKLRRSGIGSALMRKTEEFAKSIGIKHCFVDTVTFQGPHFYPKLGYREIYRVKAFNDEQTERIYFQKEI